MATITSSSNAQWFGQLFRRLLKILLPFLKSMVYLKKFFTPKTSTCSSITSDKNIVLARKHASLTWGDCSFTIMAWNTIEPRTVANGGLVRSRTLTEEGKELVLERMHSKILGHQVMELMAPSACQAIGQHAHIFTWITQNGREEEVNGLTIIALILSRIQPNFKVDMYSEITKVKQLTIAQYDNDVQLFFDAIKFLKLHINQKNPTAYTEDAFILRYLSPTEARIIACRVLN